MWLRSGTRQRLSSGSTFSVRKICSLSLSPSYIECVVTDDRLAAGLKYDDILNEFDPDVKLAVERLPKDQAVAR
jgi:hypothetical protein